MSAKSAAIETRTVSHEEVRSWVVRATELWLSRWWRLAGVALFFGAVLHLVPAPLELVAVLAFGPSVLWAVVVTADPQLGPGGAGGSGPLPGWLPGAIRVVPLGLLVASVAISILFASVVVFAAVLAAMGVDPRVVVPAEAGPGGGGGVVPYLARSCGTGASLIVFGALSLLYARGFGLFFKAAFKVPTAKAIEAGRIAWQRNAAAVAQACRVARKWHVASVLAAAALFFVLFFSGASEPAALLLSTYVPCLFAVVFRSVFPEAARAAGGVDDE